MNGYLDITVGLSRTDFIRFLFVQLDEGLSLQKKAVYTRRIGDSHCGCCCPHKETCRSAETLFVAKCIEVDGGIFEHLCEL